MAFGQYVEIGRAVTDSKLSLLHREGEPHEDLTEEEERLVNRRAYPALLAFLADQVKKTAEKRRKKWDRQAKEGIPFGKNLGGFINRRLRRPVRVLYVRRQPFKVITGQELVFLRTLLETGQADLMASLTLTVIQLLVKDDKAAEEIPDEEPSDEEKEDEEAVEQPVTEEKGEDPAVRLAAAIRALERCQQVLEEELGVDLGKIVAIALNQLRVRQRFFQGELPEEITALLERKHPSYVLKVSKL